MRHIRHLSSYAAFLTFLGATAITSLLQVQRAEAQAATTRNVTDLSPGGGTTQPNEIKNPIVVHESAIAREILSNAEKRDVVKDWSGAADLYQKLLENLADQLVPVSVDKDGITVRYTSVAHAVRERLCHWPREGLDAYCRINESKAAELLEQARKAAAAGQDDSAAFDEVLRLYFVTESAKAAALRLMDEELDRGDFFAAAWMGDELLNLHPNLAAERPAVLFQTALAYRLAGDAKAADERAATLAGKFPNETGVVRGKVLAQALGPGTASPPVISRDSWPMMGGNVQRDGVPTGHAKSGVRIASIQLAQADYRGLTRPQETMLRQQIDAIAQGGATLGIMPAVDRGELFFQDGTRIYAVRLVSGDPLPGWVRTWGADRQGRYVLPDVWGSTRAHQQAITLTDQQVLAVMGQPDNSAMQFGAADRGEARLVCLDRETGKENWVIAPSTMKDVPKNDDEKAVRALQLSGSPLVVGDNALVIGRSNTQGQGDDCYVLAFDLSYGHYRWGCYIASSGMGMNPMWGMPVMASGDRTSHLAYGNGRVYVLTNLGAVAALDARDGTIVWLDIYPADGMPRPVSPLSRPELRHRIKPWMVNPVVVHDGKLFALPADGDSVLIYDSASGREEKRINLDQLAHWYLRNGEQPDRPTTLLGVMGERLVLAGDSRVLCLDWHKYDEQRFPGPNDEMILWPSVSPFGIRGRCFMTFDTLIVPGEDRLRWIDMKTGAAVDEYPRYPRPWGDGESPGNVVVSGNRTVIAGASSVDIYADLALVTVELDRDIASAPNAPGPRLRYAEVMDASGRADEALSRLNEAEKLIEGETPLALPGPGGDRDRLFNDAMAYATRNASDYRPETLKRVSALFDLAARAAFSLQQQVDYRIARARFYGPGYPEAAVKLYQEILADPRMRAISQPGAGDFGFEQSLAAAVAEKAIHNLIRVNGPEVYAVYQKAAEKELEAAHKLQDHPVQMAGMLLRTAQSYPNSTEARHAMVAAAEAYERAGEPRQAIRVLRQMWFDYSLQGTTPVAIAEGLARNYLAVTDRRRSEMVNAAAERLGLAASLRGDPKLSQDMKLPDGRLLPAGTPMAKALDEIRRIRGNDAGMPLPDLRLPVSPTPAERLAGVPAAVPFLGQDPNHRQVIPPDAATVLPGVTALLAPQRDFGRVDRIVAWGAGAVAIFPAGKAAPLFTVKAFPDAGHGNADAPTGTAWIGDTALIWGPSRLIAVDASAAGKGKKLWDVEIARIDDVRPVGDRVLVSTGDGHLLALDIDSGLTAWHTHLGERPFDRLLATEEFIVAKLSDDIACRLVALDTYSGRVLGTKVFAVQVQDPILHVALVPVNLALSAGGTLVYTMPDRLCIKDLYKPWNEEEKVAAAQPVQAVYLGADQPGQLLISGGRVLALRDRAPGAKLPDQKWVSICSLDTGEPVLLKYSTADGTQRKIDRVMTAETRDWNVLLRVVGTHVYVVGPHAILAYNLDKPGEMWNGTVLTDKKDPTNVRDVFCGQHHLVVLGQSLSAPTLANGDPTEVRLTAYARRPAHEKDPNSPESGRLDYDVTLTDAAGVQPNSWQACDGGFYYATDDGKVHMLRGATGPNS